MMTTTARTTSTSQDPRPMPTPAKSVRSRIQRASAPRGTRPFLGKRLLASLSALLALAVPATRATAQTGATNQQVVVADFNHDGIPDVLLPSQTSPTLTIAFGSLPYGTFSPATRAVTLPSACLQIVGGGAASGIILAADFNADGFPDIFFTCSTSTTTDASISGVALGNGDGTFAPPVMLTAPANLGAAAGDFNQDGKMDLVVLAYPNGRNASSQTPSLLFFAGNGDGTFAQPVASPLGTSATFQPASYVLRAPLAADIDGDGYPDIVLTAAYGGSLPPVASTGIATGATITVNVFGNKKDGTFGIPSSATTLPDVTATIGTYPTVSPNYPQKVLTGSFYTAGATDLALPDTGTAAGIFLIQNTSTPNTFSLATPAKTAYANLHGAATARFTGSGFSDLAIQAAGSIRALTNDGTGNFTAAYSSLSFAFPFATFSVADANNDGYTDVYAASVLNGVISLAVNLVSGSATATTAPLSLPLGTTSLSATWPGNLNFTGSSASGTQTVNLAPTTVTLSSSLNPSPTGSPVTFTASVAPSVSTSVIPTGTLILSDGDSRLASGTLDSTGTFTFTTTSLPATTHTIQAVYSGDATYATSTSAILSQVVNSIAPTLTWVPAPITAGTPLGANQLNALATNATGASIPGVYVYTPPAGTVLSAGSQTLSVTFTPTDQTAYNVASLSVPITVLPSAQTPLTANLLLNPGAELGLVDGAIPNWTAAGEGSPTVDSGTFDRGINPHTGAYDFLGFNGASDTLSQTVSLLSQTVTAALIDSGTVSASLSFWEQGLSQGTPSDDASVTLTFLDSDGATISSVNSGEIDSHNSAWQNFTATYPLPAGTRSITYTMNFIRHAGGDNDAFVDDNSLILTTPTAAAATTTTLAITSGGSTVTTVASGTPITLTATVLAGTTVVTPGQVNFCDASATYCTDIHLLGTAQLTSTGTATLKFIPGIGSHTYTAVFPGTTAALPAASAASIVTVTGTHPTTTALASTGVPGNYTLTASTVGIGSTATPTGTVAFLNKTLNNASIGTATLGSGVTGLIFKGVISATTGENPQTRSAIGDFNGDGILDIATANTAPDASPTIYANTVTIALGRGDGTFTTLTTHPATGRRPESIVTADFNGDGKLDLATVNQTDGSVTILLGNGDGSFTAAPTQTVGTNPYGIVVADFNGDGNIDIAVTQINGISILLGNGDGTFRQLTTTLSGSLASVVSADFNSDGKADLAVQNFYPTSQVVVLLGNGDGTFTTSATIGSISTGSNENAIAVGDFNGDGKPDMAVTDSAGNKVTILTGKGDGTFTSSTVSAFNSTDPIDIRTADFNGDGKLDLVTVNFTGSARETVLLGNGDGTFTSTAISTGVSAYDALAIGDFNGDGIPDLASNLGGSSLQVALTQITQTASATLSNVSVPGTGTFQITASYPGDTLYAPSTSAPIPLTAQLIPTITTLTTSLTPSPAGTAVTFTATIAPITSNGLTATGSITFTDGTLPLGTVTLSPTGTATVTTSSLTPTTHTIRAVYSGDANFATSNATLAQIVQPAAGLTFSTRTLTFPNQTVGTQSAPQPVLISNFSGTTINIFDFLLILGAAPSDFTQTNNCPAAFLPGATCTLNISFIPHGVGLKSAGVEIDDDSNPSSQSVNFSGTGTGGILQVNPGNLKTIAGNGTAGYSGDNGLATAAQLNLPAGVVVDPTGIVYIADELNNVVRKVDLSGKITTIAGTGVPAYTGDGALATAATLRFPATLTLDTAGNLYIFDDGNNVVRKITTSTGIITTIAGTGVAGHAGDGGPATAARLNQPQGGKFDKSGNLYIPDCVGSNLRKVDTNGIITTVAGNFTAGFSGDGGPATSAQLFCPSGVDIDAAGNLYIADDLNHRIRKVSTSGIITTIAGDGTPAYNGDNSPAATAELNLPNDVALDAAGNLYIADSGNNRIRRIDTTGTITTVAGGLQDAGSAGVNTPLSLTIAPSGSLYFVDSGNNAVRQLFPAGATPFPATPLGTPAAPQTLTLSNIGNVPVSIASAQSFTLSGNPTDFALTGGTCLTGATLAANGGACTLQITFTPTATGLRMLTVSIVDTALNSPQSFTISGTGAISSTPTLAWTPAVATIPYGTPLGPQQLNATATNLTGAALTGTFTYTPAAGTVLSAGAQTLSVLFTPTSPAYTPTSATTTITVTQATPTLAWATPAPIAQGTPLSATQLNATAAGVTGAALPGTFTYTPVAGTIPATGTQTLSVLFTPTDTLDYTTATTTVRLTVTGLTLTSFTPNTASLGDPAKSITLTGTAFTTGSVAQVNGVSIATTYVNPTTLTAIVPAANFAAVGTLTVTVANPVTAARTQALPLTVTAPTPSVTLAGPTTTQPGSQPTLALTVANPYPVPLTATFTLSFASAVTPTVDDPAIQFANGGRTFTFTVAANSTAVPAIQLQAGTVAGTITVPLTLTAAGVNVTPTTVRPVTIVVPAAVPAVTTATITRAATSFTVTIHGFSNTREVATAAFHFTPATGAQIDTPDVTIPVTPIFSGWFTSDPSVPYGSTFTYTQIFNVSDTAASIGSVQVTLTNSVGVSTVYTAQ